MEHKEIEELLGAYALDATDPAEKEIVEAHLIGCARCRGEMTANLAVATALGNSGALAPEGVWERIAAEIGLGPAAAAPAAVGVPAPSAVPGASSQPAPGKPSAALPGASSPTDQAELATVRPVRSWVRTALVAIGSIAAALAVVVGLLSARVGTLDHQVSSLRNAIVSGGAAGQAQAASSDPAHRTVTLSSTTAPWKAVLVVLPDGHAFLEPRSMPRLPASETFQVWVVRGHSVISLGVIGRSPGTVAVQLQRGMSLLMVNAEPLGGTAQPTTQALVQGTLPHLL
ncbi:MAG: anti-sigma factor domain-containing protein [Acidimicrobiales bacterium]